MPKSLIDMFLNELFGADWTGRHGEALTERELNLVKLFGRKGKVLRNLYVPKDDGGTSEIDVVFITQKGIFVIESKNYSGWIFGDEQSTYWTAMLPNREKHRFYNPIKQNAAHIKWLGKYLSDNTPLFSLIVFSERCQLKKVSVDSPEVKVIKRDKVYAAVRSIWDASEDHLSETQVDEISEKLQVLTNVSWAAKAAHVAEIHGKYRKQQAAAETTVFPKLMGDFVTGPKSQTASEETICPRCGSKLVLRTAKKGANAGNQFYGCSSFPKCRYVRDL